MLKIKNTLENRDLFLQKLMYIIHPPHRLPFSKVVDDGSSESPSISCQSKLPFPEVPASPADQTIRTIILIVFWMTYQKTYLSDVSTTFLEKGDTVIFPISLGPLSW